jgi:hypothetical protein
VGSVPIMITAISLGAGRVVMSRIIVEEIH